MLGFWGYYLLPPQRRRAEKIMAWKPAAGTDAELTPGQKIVKDGVELANSLIAMERADGPAAPAAWKVLADVWTELVVYLAPSSDEERVKGHEDILVQGGEFITVLWALTTHIGVSRNAARTGAGATNCR
ncbi:hypothetical protein BS78_K176400 [Paspalum vaginatum]|uniref:Uncharacterized protein n=1 Tax=Paspalum vaginatum TaxID=158149 RepID=A0A9W8CDJ6_9POAL|nr:hypothetical protein BS78_K176400 [Paspalum vaginatum]